MTPFSSVAMLEKFSLLEIAFCSAPGLEQDRFAPDLGDDIRASGILEMAGSWYCADNVPTSIELDTLGPACAPLPPQLESNAATGHCAHGTPLSVCGARGRREEGCAARQRVARIGKAEPIYTFWSSQSRKASR